MFAHWAQSFGIKHNGGSLYGFNHPGMHCFTYRSCETSCIQPGVFVDAALIAIICARRRKCCYGFRVATYRTVFRIVKMCDEVKPAAVLLSHKCVAKEPLSLSAFIRIALHSCKLNCSRHSRQQRNRGFNMLNYTCVRALPGSENIVLFALRIKSIFWEITPHERLWQSKSYIVKFAQGIRNILQRFLGHVPF